MHRQRRLAGLLVAACFTAAALAQTETPPDASIFAPVQIAGDLSTGFPAFYYGCTSNGATLQDIIVFANDNFLRGIEVNLTDGRLVQFGCVNTTSGQSGCIIGQLDASIRMASFRFAPGERVTQMALFSGPDDSGRPNARAGAISFATSLGRLFDFGNKKPRDQPVNVDVASGVPCGVAARRGADIDAVGFIFLHNISASVLYNVSYSGIPTDQANSTAFSATYSSTQLQNMTYDNSGGSDAHTYTYASEFSQARPTDWSHALGVDAYSGGNVTAGVPQLLTRNDSDAPQGWQVGPEGPHQRADNALQADQWSYNIPVPAGAIYTAQVSLLQGKIALPYSGTLSLLLDTGGNITVPIQGTYTGTTYAPAKVDIMVVKPGHGPAEVTGTTVQNSAPQMSGGNNHGWAIAVGIILGVLLVALIAVAAILLRRKRQREEFQANSKANHLGTYPGDAAGGQHAKTGAAAAAAGAGAGAGLGSRLSSSFKSKKPNTPRATQAPPGAPEEAPHGMWRMMPAGLVSSRFQQLFRGKGHGEEDLSTAERGLSTTSNHSHAPEIPLGHEPSPTKGYDAGAAGNPAAKGPATPTSPFEANVAAVTQADKVEAAQPAPGSGRPLPRAGSTTSTMSGVSGVEQGSSAAKKRGSIEHEGTPIKLGAGRSRSGVAGVARKLSLSDPAKAPRT